MSSLSLRVAGFLVAAASLTGGVRDAAAQAALLQRPTEVAAIMRNSPKLFDGTYRASAVSRMCGETDPLQSFTGQRIFLVEYPLDYLNDAEIVDVRFSSKALVGGVTETQKFFVSVNVRQPSGAKPQAYVVDTERPAPRNSGRATLNVAAGTARLTVQAQDELGRLLELTVICRPSAP